MAIVSLYNNNKNQFRKYPIKQSCSCTDISGQTLPNSFITNCSISTKYGSHKIYISQIFIDNQNIDITISSQLESGKVLGRFSGTALEDFSKLDLISNDGYTSGAIVLGTIRPFPQNSIQLFFNSTALEIEESRIFCYTPPAVSSISDKLGTKLTGFVRFGTLANVLKTTITNHTEGIKQTALAAEFPEDVFNLSDKSTYLNNCPTPIINAINSTTPSYYGDTGENSKNDGNIYFVGINPIRFYGIPSSEMGAPSTNVENGVLGLSTEGITLSSLCTKKNKNLPPVDITGISTSEFIDQYYNKPALVQTTSPDYPYDIPARAAANLNHAKKPEYYFWPQFVREEYYSLWPAPLGATGATGAT